MKHIYGLLLSCMLWGHVQAQDPAYPLAPAAPQNIVAAEYFIDTDPGFGSGMAITIAPGGDINNISATINTSGLSNGAHYVFIRTKSNEGNWSFSNSRAFIVDFDPAYSIAPTPQNIVAAEYFIDIDPGFGSGTTIAIAPGVAINNINATINTNGLSNGVHYVFIRTKNNEGNWSISNSKGFLVDSDPVYSIASTPQNIVAAEYFIDADPGFGSGTAIALTPGVDQNNLNAAINTTGLSIGVHKFYLRSKTNEGSWAVTSVSEFIVDENPAYPPVPSVPGNITYAEYFVDTDPGFGNAAAIAISPGIDLNDVSFAVNTTGLPDGNHILFIRSLDDWSITNFSTFAKGNPLPLHLLSFSAAGSKDDVLLKWVTDNEVNSSHFDIEFSEDASNFERITEVIAANTPGKHQYEYTHMAPSGNVLYYRIKQTDLDGKFMYSEIVKVMMKKNTLAAFLYPNPTSNNLWLGNTKAEDIKQIQVLDANGKIVRHISNTHSLQLDMNHLPGGAYMLKLLLQDREQHLPFIKQ